ncbi:DUF6528 family protein [Chitinophaga sp. MM2321]|uniref:DUF6528 family protein n=1 Tax=Chitinophaga sp. MM2321 TaxID=3137178 RepID=UPI0032D59F64
MKFPLIVLTGLLLYTTACSGKAGIAISQPVEKPDTPTVAACNRCVVVAEQSQHRITIADLSSGAVIWEWKPSASNVDTAHIKWFNNPSDVKPVYHNKFILMTASGGAVALIRIADKKVVFYAYAGGNTHSAEILPDGNIVSASSTGNHLTLFRTDTTAFPGNVYTKTVPVDFGHNVVWDADHQRLWSADRHKMWSFKYNFNREAPDLIVDTSFTLPGEEAHDLYPVYGEKTLWLTNTTHVYKFDINTLQLKPAGIIQDNIKSVSSGPAGYPTIVAKPNESWWTDEILDGNGKRIFKQKGWKIYKVRWLIPE